MRLRCLKGVQGDGTMPEGKGTVPNSLERGSNVKKILVSGVIAASLALVLSSCFALQGFSVLSATLAPGANTKAQFVMHPFQRARMYSGYNIRTLHQFVLVGVPTGGPLSVGKATWGTNGTFGGPQSMPAAGGLAAAIDLAGTCSSNGITFDNITNTTWKGFLTLNPVNDKGKVGMKTITQVVVKAASDATSGSQPVVGVTGAWLDGGDGLLDGNDDIFGCTGIAWVNVFVT